MTCRETIEWLLEAEPDELAGRGEGEAAEHVRSCARCRAVAERLLDAQALLAAELTAPPRVGVEEAIEKVVLGSAQPLGKAGVGGGGPALPLRHPGDRSAVTPPPGRGNVGGTAGGGVRGGRRALRALVPLAAAAAVVALLLVRHDVPPPAFEDVAGPRSVAPAPPVALPVVIAPAGRNAALFHTSDPRITVVWIY